LPGVVRTRVGYAGGTTDSPTYYNIGDHSETVQVDYDSSAISYQQLLEVFWSAHNPGSPSLSRQYRSAIFFHDAEQQRLAEESKKRLQKEGRVFTDIEPLSQFYIAEDYHQKYYLRGVDVLMRELRAQYPEERGFIDSTVAARLNGYVGGFGTMEELEQELESFGLSEQAEQYIRNRVSRKKS
jgi:peptide-methionine (S)-S-oxide reductase